jgi:hypothetical protein
MRSQWTTGQTGLGIDMPENVVLDVPGVGGVSREEKHLRVTEVHVQHFGVAVWPRTEKADITTSCIDLHACAWGKAVGRDCESRVERQNYPKGINSGIAADGTGRAELDGEIV